MPLKTTVPQSVVLQRTPVHSSQISVRVVVYAPLCVRQVGNGVRYQTPAKVPYGAVCHVCPDPILLRVIVFYHHGQSAKAWNVRKQLQVLRSGHTKGTLMNNNLIML